MHHAAIHSAAGIGSGKGRGMSRSTTWKEFSVPSDWQFRGLVANQPPELKRYIVVFEMGICHVTTNAPWSAVRSWISFNGCRVENLTSFSRPAWEVYATCKNCGHDEGMPMIDGEKHILQCPKCGHRQGVDE